MIVIFLYKINLCEIKKVYDLLIISNVLKNKGIIILMF